MQNTKETQSTSSWLEKDSIKSDPILPQLLKHLVEATQLSNGGRHFACMMPYLFKVAGHAITPVNETEIVSWRLTYKALKCTLNKNSKVPEGSVLYCKIGIVSKNDWESSLQKPQQKCDLQNEQVHSTTYFNTPSRHAVLNLTPAELQEKVLVIELWRDPSARKLSLPVNEKTFIGRAHFKLNDLSILDQAPKELSLYSHSKKNERGTVCVQICLRASEAGKSEEITPSYETLFKAILKFESLQEDGKFARNWSGNIPPLARSLLDTHAALFEIDAVNRVAIDLRLLMDYHEQYAVSMNVFVCWLEELKKAFASQNEKVVDDATNHGYEESQPQLTSPLPEGDLTTTPMKSPPAISQATSPSTISQVVSPSAISQETSPSAILQVTSPSAILQVTSPSAVSQVTSPSAILQVTSPSAISQEAAFFVMPISPTAIQRVEASTSQAAPNITTDCYKVVTSLSPSPQTNDYEKQLSNFKEILNGLCSYIEEKLSKHLFMFDITKHNEIEEHLKALQASYTLLDPLTGDSNFQAALRTCVERGTIHWMGVCKEESQPERGDHQYTAKSLKALTEACSAKCKDVKEHVVSLFAKYGVDYFPIFIQVVESKFSEYLLSEKEIQSLDDETVILYLQAYSICKQLQEYAKSSQPDLKLWTIYEPLVGRWIEVFSNRCKDKIKKAIEVDELTTLTDQHKFSSSPVDVELILHEMLTFWKDLGWPDDEQAFGFGCKLLENLIQCVVYYVEMSYQHCYDKYFQEQGISIKICVFLSSIIEMRDRAIAMFGVLVTGKTENETKTLNELKTSACRTIEQKIKSCMEQICELMLLSQIVDKLGSPGEQQVERVTELLDQNLSIFKENLPNEVYCQYILHVVWNITLKAVEKQLGMNKKENEREALHSTLLSLKDFFSAAIKDKELATPLYKRLAIQTLPAKDLILQCCLQLVELQSETGPFSIGELSFSFVYVEGKTALEVNILNAKLVSRDDTKIDSIKSCVQMWLHPQFMFPGRARTNFRTEWTKGLSPLYSSEHCIPAQLEDLRKDGAILVLAVYLTDTKRIAGLCVVPCKDVPILQNDSGRKKVTLPLFLATMPNNGPLKELEDRANSGNDHIKDFAKILRSFWV